MWYLFFRSANHRRFSYGGGFWLVPACLTKFSRLPMLVFFLLVSLLPVNAIADWHKQEKSIMGTLITVEFWDEDNRHAQQCAEQVFSEMRRIDALMSPYKPNSELSRINQLAAKEATLSYLFGCTPPAFGIGPRYRTNQ